MFDLGWTELMVVGIVALIVVGPKDLPGMFRTLGQYTGKARKMAREFKRAMEDAADEAGVKDVTNTLKTAANPGKAGMDALKDATSGLTKFDEPELSGERAEAARKIHEATATKEATRRAADVAEDIAEELADDVADAATEATKSTQS